MNSGSSPACLRFVSSLLRRVRKHAPRANRALALVGGLLAAPAFAQISTPPQNQAAAAGASATFTVVPTSTSSVSYQWDRNGVALAGATGASLTVTDVQPVNTGIYSVTVTSGTTTATASAALGLTATAKVTGAGSEVGTDIRHPLGNIYDQILLQGAAATITADAGQVTRISYVDLNNDIVQIEFAGAGALSLVLDNASGPAAPVNYNQPTVAYMKGHAGIVIVGANETTHVSVFSVGRGNAVNQALFRSDVTYDGLADIGFLAVQSTNGKFGGLRTANASYFATKGLTGVFAPGVAFTGPTFVGDINAFETATPVFRVGSTSDARITGGDLFQTNAKAVLVGGIAQLRFTDGSTSHSTLLTARTNLGVLEDAGVNVTAQIVVNPIRPSASLYFAQLRPIASAASSTASGYAAISIVGSVNALIDVNISNLSSAQTTTYLRLSGTDDAILRLPAGQVIAQPWTIAAVGSLSRDAIITALNEGRLYLSLETVRHPAGEVAGTMIATSGSTVFSAPTTPPVLPSQHLSSPSDIDAARLLTQATFGATTATIADVKRLGVTGWINEQKALPASSLLAILRDDAARFPNPLKRPDGSTYPRVDFFFNQNISWWKLAVAAPDQLRQRVAFALSEILVIASDEQSRTEPIANYYDVLASHAFGNFRSLLEKVSTHPEMGWYLTFLRNQKADPVKGTSPDENYAREIQQLFTIGLVQLQPDGTLLLDAQGRPIPTYDNITITETAKVFTGWAYQNKNNSFYSDPAWDGTPGGYSDATLYLDTNGRMQPLKVYEDFHDKTEKRVISLQQAPPRQAAPTIIPANQTGPADLTILLDALVNHPNTAPFISKQLIQRLVTSNPSAGYVYRVAQTFVNNGQGVRGDLGAVVTAILSDYEARSPDVLANQGYGKLKEPLLRVTGLMRMLKTAAPNGRFSDSYFNDPRSNGGFYPVGFFSGFQRSVDALGQSPFHAPSVFNFFSAFYSPPGKLSDSGLVAPEMQITDSNLAIKTPNTLTNVIYKELPVVADAPSPSPFLRNDLTEFLDLSPDVPALLARINLLLCANQMSAATQAVVRGVLESIPVVPPLANTSSPTQFAVNIAGWNTGLAASKVAAFDPGSAFTMETWVFPRAFSGPYSTWLMGKGLESNMDPWLQFGLTVEMAEPRRGKVTLSASQGTAGTNRGITSAAPLIAGKWSHVAGVIEGTAIRLYIDGTLAAQGTLSGPIAARPTTPFALGNARRPNGEWGWTAFDGYMSQARFWNVARTAAQIAAGMNQSQPSERTGLVAGWLLNEGTGLIAADYSGNNHFLERPDTRTPTINWAPTDGKSLERVHTALHLSAISPDAAVQK